LKLRKIVDGVLLGGALDWNRRLFDSLIPLPDGTSYNAYVISGSEKTVLLDAVDPKVADTLMAQLDEVPKIDYVVAHHGEQDHSGVIPMVIDRYPEAKVVVSSKGKPILMDHLSLNEDKFLVVEDGQEIALGGKTLKFIYTPWVHWPETMVTYLKEDRILFSCDFFASHLATTEMFVRDEPQAYKAAKRFFAEIMMPFRPVVAKNLDKLEPYAIDMIAPSHGQIYDNPAFIVDAYRKWVGSEPHNLVCIPYVTMHGSTHIMVEHLTDQLVSRGVVVEQFDLPVTDIGDLAVSLVDAATIVVGTPTVLVGPHPHAAYAAVLANALKPKAKFAAIIGSYGWGSKAVETIQSLIPNLKVEVLGAVLTKGHPKADALAELDKLAEAIAQKHRELGVL